MRARFHLFNVAAVLSGNCFSCMICSELGVTHESVMANEPLPTGVYRHYKGNEYAVIGVAKQSETQEKLVIYRALDSGKMWARPLEMFREKVELAGK